MAIRCLAAEQAIAAMHTSCEYCNSNMSRGELRDHLPICPRRPVRCSAEACTTVVPHCELAAHEQFCAHVICAAAESRMQAKMAEQLTAMESRMQAKMAEQLTAMQTLMDADVTAQHVMNQFRECQRHPPGPGFRVELVEPDVDMSDFFRHPTGIAATALARARRSRIGDASGRYNRLLCLVPGASGTDWEGGCFPLLVSYRRWNKPPVVRFPPFEGPDLPTQHYVRDRPNGTITELAVPPAQARAADNTIVGAYYLSGGFLHNNVYPSGKVCLSILDEEKAWHPSLTLAEVLISVQHLLNDPNNSDPAQEVPFILYKYQRDVHDRRVREQAARYTADNFQRLVSRYCLRPIRHWGPGVGPGGGELQWTEDGQHRVVIGVGG